MATAASVSYDGKRMRGVSKNQTRISTQMRRLHALLHSLCSVELFNSPENADGHGGLTQRTPLLHVPERFRSDGRRVARLALILHRYDE